MECKFKSELYQIKKRFSSFETIYFSSCEDDYISRLSPPSFLSPWTQEEMKSIFFYFCSSFSARLGVQIFFIYPHRRVREKTREYSLILILPPLVSHLALSTLNFSDFPIFLSSINIVFYQSFLFIVFHLLFICLQFICLSNFIWFVLCHTFCPIHSSLISFPSPPSFPPSFPLFPLPFFSSPSILFLFSSTFYLLSFFLLTFATILNFST